MGYLSDIFFAESWGDFCVYPAKLLYTYTRHQNVIAAKEDDTTLSPVPSAVVTREIVVLVIGPESMKATTCLFCTNCLDPYNFTLAALNTATPKAGTAVGVVLITATSPTIRAFCEAVSAKVIPVVDRTLV